MFTATFETLLTTAKVANKVEYLISAIKLKYAYQYDKRNALLDKVEIKYEQVNGITFFDRGKQTAAFIRLLYAYRISCKGDRKEVFYKVLNC